MNLPIRHLESSPFYQYIHHNNLPPPPRNAWDVWKHPHVQMFLEAMDLEYWILDEKETWEVVDYPANTFVILLIWILSYKFND